MKRLPEATIEPRPRGVDRLTPMLSRHQFIRQLYLEKRRADRSKAPLSVVTVQLKDAGSDQSDQLNELAALLLSGRRETDIHGCLAGDVLAVLLPDTRPEGAEAVARSLRNNAGGLRIDVGVATYPDDVFERLLVDDAAGREFDPLLLQGLSDKGRASHALKRAIDVVGSLGLLLAASPLMLATSLAIAATSTGPVIFRQIRLGRAGVKFVCYKFRSMRVDADDRIHRDYVSNLIDGRLDQINQGDAEEPLYKIKVDPRVTRVGRIIRATSIDELPQLFNVLKGDMSLVGPRPPLPYEAEKYQSWHLRRVLDVRPGITGLWQVEGRSRTSFDDMVRLDLRYISDWSPWLDIKILAKTVLVVLGRQGAG
ncbi:MAG: sugar transferase [Steroidobacteraceae bacterium]